MWKADLISSVVFLTFSAFYYFFLIPYQIKFSIPAERHTRAVLLPTFFPRLSILLFALLSLSLLLGALRRREGVVGMRASPHGLLRTGAVFIISCLYVLALEWVGFSAASPIFLAVLILSMGTRNWRYILPFALLLPLIVNYFFWYSFRVILPEGILFN